MLRFLFVFLIFIAFAWNVFSPTSLLAQRVKETQKESPGEKLPEITQAMPPEKLLDQIEKTWEVDLNAENEQAKKEIVTRVLERIVTASNYVIANQKATEKQVLEAVQNKMQALGMLARGGDTKATMTAMAMANELKQDKRPLLAREGNLILLSSRLQEIATMSRAERKQFSGQLLQLVSSGEIGEREIQIVQLTARFFEQSNQIKDVQQLMQKMATLLEKSKKPEVKNKAVYFAGAARRFDLPGQKMKVSGKTIDGKEFELKQFKGKVVIVHFWASWCKYCLGEMPHLLQVYHAYHDEGLEIIGVNLDESPDRAKKIISDAALPWNHLFSADQEELGMNNPLAVYYGINSLPVSILIDREGKVISLHARGKLLDWELDHLFNSAKKE